MKRATVESVPYLAAEGCTVVKAGRVVEVQDKSGNVWFTLPGSLTDEGTKEVINLINKVYGKGVAMGMQLERHLGADLHKN